MKFKSPLLIVLSLYVGTLFAMTDAEELALKGVIDTSTSAINTPFDVQSYSDTTVGGASWDRPFATGTCCSSLGPVLLHLQELQVSENDTCDVTSVQDGWDGYLFVYETNFDSLDQETNFVAGDDDGGGGIGTSDILGVPLAAGVNYYIVTTGFEAGEEGTFTNTVTCGVADVNLGPAAPVEVPTVPTLSLLGYLALFLGFMLTGFLTAKRFRNN